MPTKRKVERRRRPNRKTVKKRAMRTRRRKSLQKKRRRKTKKGGKLSFPWKKTEKTEKSEKEKILDDLGHPPKKDLLHSYETKKKMAESYVDKNFEKMKELYDLVKKEVKDKEFTAKKIEESQNNGHRLSTIRGIPTASLNLVHQKRVELLSVFKMIYELHKDKKSLENQEKNYEVTEIKTQQFALYNKETKRYYALDDIYSDLAEQLITRLTTAPRAFENKGLQAYIFAKKMSPKKRGSAAVFLKKRTHYDKQLETVFGEEKMTYKNNIQTITEPPQDKFMFETIGKVNKVYNFIYKVSKAVDMVDDTNITEEFMAKFRVEQNGNNYYLYNEHISEYIPSYTNIYKEYVLDIYKSLNKQYNYTNEVMIEHASKFNQLLFWNDEKLRSSYFGKIETNK